MVRFRNKLNEINKAKDPYIKIRDGFLRLEKIKVKMIMLKN